MSFPRYPKYKDSGVEWLGEVPQGWDVAPLKCLASFTNGAAFKPTEWAEVGYPIIRIENLNGGDNFNCFDGEPESRYLVHDGDLLFGWSGNRGTSFGPYRWRRGAVCVLNQHIFRVESNQIERNDLYWILKAVTAHVEDQAHGIIGMVHVTKGDLGAIKVPVPPPDEQKGLSLFLDRETAKIDALIAEQQRLIELLQEKRRAVISHAVTKGLNPDAPMKDSGIEWLGEVPEHWRVRPLKSVISKIEQGWSPQCESYPAEEGEWGVLKVGCVNGARFRPAEQKALPQGVEPLPVYEVREGDILASRGNTLELVGLATFLSAVRQRLLLSDLLYRFRAKPQEANGEYLACALRSPFGRYQLERDAVGTSASMKKVGQGVLRELLMALPPLEEQRDIMAAVNVLSDQLEELTREAGLAISLLQERRSALISAAVTGQIDVRGLAGSDAA